MKVRQKAICNHFSFYFIKKNHKVKKDFFGRINLVCETGKGGLSMADSNCLSLIINSLLMNKHFFSMVHNS